MENKNKIGITIFGWMLIFWGSISLILGFFVSMITIHYMGRESPYPPGGDIAISLLSNLPYACALLMTGIGLLKRKKWAKRLTLYLLVPLFCLAQPIRYFYILGFNHVERIKHVIQAGSWPQNMCPMLIPFLFGASLLYYFSRPKVKEQFK